MKILIFCILILFTTATTLYSQAKCDEYQFNKTENALIGKYISSCIRDHWFRGDKGVVELIQGINTEGKRTWHLSTVLDDAYKDNPPSGYAYSHADVILIYEGDKDFNKIVNTPTIEKLKCLEDIVLDKLYIRPQKKDQYIIELGKRIKFMRNCMGNCSNDLVIVFNPDGTYSEVSVF